MILSNPREFGDRKGQKAKIYFKRGEGERLKICPDWLPFCVSTGVGLQDLSRIQDLKELALVLWSCVPCFCYLSCFALGALLANVALFRVLRAFLAGLGVSCGFVLFWWFAWLVGLLCACGVRRIKGLRRICLSFYPFRSCFSSSLPIFLALSLLLSACPLVLSFMFWLCVFFFPFGIYAKRKGAPCWCVLSCPVVVALWVYYMLNASLSAASFAFENIHPAPQVR